MKEAGLEYKGRFPANLLVSDNVLDNGVETNKGHTSSKSKGFEGDFWRRENPIKGWTKEEDFYYDKATGVKLNTNMFDYKKTSMLDMPRVDMELLETRAGNAAYGSNGISHSLANTHLVICAIQNAIGKWIDPPATPDKVLKALGKA